MGKKQPKPKDAAQRRQDRMARVDAMSPKLRALVHEHGLTVVDQFIQCNVTNPRHIAHLIEVVRRGSVEIGNRTEAPALMPLT